MFKMNRLALDYGPKIAELNSFMDEHPKELNYVENTVTGMHEGNMEDTLMESVDYLLEAQNVPSTSTPNDPIHFSTHESDDIDWDNCTDSDGGIKPEGFFIEVPYYKKDQFFSFVNSLGCTYYPDTNRGKDWCLNFQEKERQLMLLKKAEEKEKRKLEKRGLCKRDQKTTPMSNKRKKSSSEGPPNKSTALKGKDLSNKFIFLPYDDEDIVLKIPLSELGVGDDFFNQEKECVITVLYEILNNSNWGDACYRCDISAYQVGPSTYTYKKINS